MTKALEWRLPLVLALVLLWVPACAREPRVAVIGMTGLPPDTLYLGGMEDSLMTGPHPTRVEIFDGGQSSDAYRSALESARHVVEMPGLVAVVGHRDSRSTLVVGPVYRDDGIPLVVPNATSRAIRKLGPRVFMMSVDNGEEGTFLAEVAVDSLHARQVSVFHLSDEFGTDIDEGIRSALGRDGVMLLDDVEYGVKRQVCPDDFAALVEASLLRGEPDVVILASRTRDARCIARLFGERSPSVRFLAADAVDPGDSLLLGLGGVARSVWVTQFWSPFRDSASGAFAADYERRTGVRPTQGEALRWDGVHLVAAAVREVGPDRDRVTAYLQDLGRGRPPYHGVTGDISFGAGAHHPLILVDPSGRPVSERER